MHTEVRAAETGNCISLEHISILHVSARGVYVQSENIINSSSEIYRACGNIENSNWSEACDTNQIHSYVPNILQITEFSKRVIPYMAGFVVRHLKSKLHCESCISALTGSPSCEAYSLIALKTCGGLCFPSDDVFLICQKAEKALRFASRESGGTFLKPKFSEIYLTAMVFKEFLGSESIFESLIQHALEQDCLENHRVHLIRCIIQKYVKTRLLHRETLQ